jgi:hypothetical protein
MTHSAVGLVRRSPVVVFASMIALMLGLAAPAAADPGEVQLDEQLMRESLSEVNSTLDSLDARELAILSQDPYVTVAEPDLIAMEKDGLRIEFRRDSPSTINDGGIAPMWSVGAGWSIYVYMTGSETNTFATYSTGFIASLICATYLGTFGAAVCGSIAAGLVDWITTRNFNSWMCYEFSFTYAGTPQGIKTVPGSYC